MEDTLKTGEYGELSERVPTQVGWGHREEPHGLIKALRMGNFAADGTHTVTDAQFLHSSLRKPVSLMRTELS